MKQFIILIISFLLTSGVALGEPYTIANFTVESPHESNDFLGYSFGYGLYNSIILFEFEPIDSDTHTISAKPYTSFVSALNGNAGALDDRDECYYFSEKITLFQNLFTSNGVTGTTMTVANPNLKNMEIISFNLFSKYEKLECSTLFSTQFFIEAVPIPEPSICFLFSSGIICLVYLSSRKRLG